MSINAGGRSLISKSVSSVLSDRESLSNLELGLVIKYFGLEEVKKNLEFWRVVVNSNKNQVGTAQVCEDCFNQRKETIYIKDIINGYAKYYYGANNEKFRYMKRIDTIYHDMCTLCAQHLFNRLEFERSFFEEDTAINFVKSKLNKNMLYVDKVTVRVILSVLVKHELQNVILTVLPNFPIQLL